MDAQAPAFDPDAFLAQTAAPTQSPQNQFIAQEQGSPTQPVQQPQQPPDTSNFDPDAFLNQADQQIYGTPTQKVIGASEAYSKGAIGFIAPFVEHNLLGVKYEDMAGRERAANPAVNALAEAGGFLTGMLTGSGEAKAVTSIGEFALKTGGFGKVLEVEQLGSKALEMANIAKEAVASGASNAADLVSQAQNAKSAVDVLKRGIGLGNYMKAGLLRGSSEMAALQSSNEISNMLINQQPESAETALSHIGLAAAIGGPTGAAFASISPLWRATVGDKLAPMLEDLKGTLKFWVDNPNPTEAAHNELQALHDNMTNVIEKLYSEGEGGIKGEQMAAALPKVTPEATTTINSQLESVNNLVESTLSKMEKDVKLKSKVPYLRQDLEAFQEIATNPDSTYIAKRNAVDELKKAMQGYSRYGASVEDSAFGGVTKSLAAKLKPMLEDTNVWGDAGKIQADVNKAVSEFLPTQKDMISRFTTQIAGERKIDPGKIATYINQLGKPSAEIKQEMMGNYLNKSKALIETINGLFTSKGLVAPIQPSSQAVLRYTTSEKTMGQQILDSVIQKRLKGFFGKSAAATVGGVAGAKVGQPMVGAMVGEHLLGPLFETILPGISKPLIDNPSSIEGLKSAIDYGVAVAKGDKALNQAVKGVFSGSSKAITAHAIADQDDKDKIDKTVTGTIDTPTKLMQAQGQGTALAHYMPGHQIALTQATMQTVKYLQGLKPQPQKIGPLDKPMPPTAQQVARYNRALDIAQNPLSILDKAYRGVLQTSDVQDISTMYPNYYQQIVQKLSSEMASKEAAGENIPYRTRMGISLLMGQPLDATMQPASIQAAQLSLQPQQPPEPQGKPKKVTKEAGKGLQKGAAKYQTPDQAAEADRTNRE